MLPFKTIAIVSGTLVVLSVLALPMWTLGVPGVENNYATGWKMGFAVIGSYPIVWLLLFLPYFVWRNRLAAAPREHWQFALSILALMTLLGAAARMFQAFRIMLDK